MMRCDAYRRALCVQVYLKMDRTDKAKHEVEVREPFLAREHGTMRMEKVSACILA